MLTDGLIIYTIREKMRLETTRMPKNTSIYKVLPWHKIKNLKAAKVNLKDLGAFQTIFWKMINTCIVENGIGLAATQVGIFKQIIVIRDFDIIDIVKVEPLNTFKVYLNPSWTNVGPDKIKSTESCLSVDGSDYSIERYKTIAFKWEEVVFGEDGKPFFQEHKETLEDFRSIVAQHEHDHLKGISIPQRWEMQNPRNKK